MMAMLVETWCDVLWKRISTPCTNRTELTPLAVNIIGDHHRGSLRGISNIQHIYSIPPTLKKLICSRDRKLLSVGFKLAYESQGKYCTFQ
jgi:hypothetical protein